MPGGTPEDSDRPTILLLEDEPAVRRSLQLVLQGSGFTVRSFGSGIALLADPTARHAKGMIADYRLADGDGLTVLRDLKAAGFKGRAILVTAFGSPELSARARAAGFSQVLEKPLAHRLVREAMTGLGPT